MKMLRILSLTLCTLVVGVMVSCGDDEPSNSQGDLSTDTRPTDWTVVTEDIDPQSTMTADVKVDLSNLNLNYEYDKEDMMAAFVNDKCVALATPIFVSKDSVAENVRYILTIKKQVDAGSISYVSLKLYSNKLHHVFKSMPFSYEDEGVKGSYDEPYIPEWIK